jgi:hypothetical protein
MKNLILLFLVIGAVVSQVSLTTTVNQLWAITSATPVAVTDYYSFTLTYNGGATTSVDYITTSTQEIGVVCIPTPSNFAVAASATSFGFSFSVPANATGAKSDATTNWGPLKMTSHSTLTYTVLTNKVLTAGTAVNVACTIAQVHTVANYVHQWVITVSTQCANFRQLGSAASFACFSYDDTAQIISGTGAAADITVGAATNVAFTQTTTVCAVSGASTFATGATILAGIAYLQF